MQKKHSNDRTASLIESRFNHAHEQQEELFQDFERYKTLWRSKILNEGDYPWDYTLFNPMVYAAVRTFVSRISTGNVGVNLQAWNEQERPKTRINKALLEWEFQEVDLFQKVARWVFGSFMYGRSFVRTGWVFQKERYIEEVDEEGKPTRKILIAPKVNRADLENVRVFDMFMANRNITELQKQPWIIRRSFKTIPEMIAENEARGGDENNGPYRNLKRLKDQDWFVREIDYGSTTQKPDEEGDKKDKWRTGVLEVLELCDKERGQVIEKIKGHDDFVIREEENPYYHGEYPYIDLPFFPEDDEYWSPGGVMPIEDLQMALNSTLNQYLTNANQQINNMWVQKSGGRAIPEWELISRPNGIIHGDVEPVKHADVTSQAEAMMGRLETQLQRTTGITDQLSMGVAPRGTRGAAFLQLEQQNLDDNLKLFLTMLEQVGIKHVARHFLSLNKQFITSDQIVKITGRHGYSHMEIKPDDVSAAFDPIIIPQSSLPKNPLVRAQNLMQLKELADKEQHVKVNTAPIWKEIIDTMGMTDLDEIVPDDMDEALQENELIKKGVPVECEANDNHDQHIKVHQYELIAGELEQGAGERMIEHIKTHKTWKLAADPDLLEKMAQGQQPTPGNSIEEDPAEAPAGVDPQMAMQQAMMQGGMPAPQVPGAANAPVDTTGLIPQEAQFLDPRMTPPGMPPVESPLLAELGGGGF